VTRVLLARHGATEHTAQGRFSGCTGADPQLSAVGRRQAGRLADALRQGQAAAETAVTSVVCSPVRRARETAETVAAALDLSLQMDEDWREIDFGAWEGLTVEQVTRRWGGELAAWRSDARRRPPGGEAVEGVAHRVRDALCRQGQRAAGGTVLVVSHLYPVRLSVLDALGAPHEAVHRMVHEPTAVSEIRWQAGPATLVRYNDAGHLRG
jgi:probable phosphoglycerate mutase